MRRKILRTAKGRSTFAYLQEKKKLYDETNNRELIERYQLERFNRVWANVQTTSPFYRDWKMRHGLPSRIGHIRDLTQFPVLQKRDLVSTGKSLLQEDLISGYYTSGGTTGQPAQFPRGKGEELDRYTNTYLGRSWLGITPGDTYLHLWGHAHLFGYGAGAVVNKQKRKIRDYFSGGTRVSAYDQSDNSMDHAVNLMQRTRPEYVIGYASALVNLSGAANRLDSPSSFRPKWVISTAETLLPADEERIASSLGAQVANEYGSIETGLIAHSRPDRGERLATLWHSIAANCTSDGSLRLTTLDTRAFPLINYEIGDQVSDPDDRANTTSFRTVHGRTQDLVTVRTLDGRDTPLSIIPIVGALKYQPGIRTVQVAQKKNSKAEVYFTADGDVDLEEAQSLVVNSLKKSGVHLNPEHVTLKEFSQPVRSVAGKTRLLIDPQESD